MPYDREDLHALSGRLDDVCDHIDEAASQMVVYGVRHVPEAAITQSTIVRDACRALAGAVERMDDPTAANERLVEVHMLENTGDTVLREAIAALFAGNTDALVVIRWKASTSSSRARSTDASRRRTCSRARSSRAGDVSVLIVLVVATALVFDFTNGFHDAATAIATSVSTRALTPRVALTLAAVMNFVGRARVDRSPNGHRGHPAADAARGPDRDPAGLLGAIVWNLITWYVGSAVVVDAGADRRARGAALVPAGRPRSTGIRRDKVRDPR